MLPWAHPSPNPKRHLDRFSRFCIAHGIEFLYFTTGCPYPLLKIAPSHSVGSGLRHDSLGPPEFSTQTGSRSVQPFLYSSLQSVSILYNGPPLSTVKLPLPMGDLDPHLINGSFSHPSSQPNNPNGISIGSSIFGRPFVKRFATCYRTVVCPVCPVCL